MLSFVIPAKNESTRIGRTVETIQRVLPSSYEHEVIVVDNGSDDDTARAARAAGAIVYQQQGGTIGSVRNLGVRMSKGEILVFLDADVLLTEAWASRLPIVLSNLASHPRLLAGSVCAVPENPSWLERWWFAPHVRDGHTHIGSAHLLARRDFFEELGGFDESLETGEDYELSRRAVSRGGELLEDVGLVAIHEGNPRSLRAFVRREIWHGSGDWQGIEKLLRSKVALAAILFAALHIIILSAVFLRNLEVASAGISAVLVLCGAFSYRAYRGAGLATVLVNTYLYYWYFVGRVIALFRGPSRGSGFVHRDTR